MLRKCFIIIMILALTIGIASAEDNLTLEETDTPLGDGGEISISDVQDRINNAEEGSTVEVNGTYNRGYTKEKLSIDKSVTIKGNDATINSNGYLTVNVSRGDVIIRDFEFNTHTSMDTFLKNSGNLTFINCRFNEIYDIENAGTLSMIDCVVNDTAIRNSGKATFTDCTFENYYTTIENQGNMRIEGCEINHIYEFKSMNGTFEIIDSKVISENGNARLYADCISILNTKFTNTSVSLHSKGSRISKSTFTDNYIYIYGNITELSECEFHNIMLSATDMQDDVKLTGLKGDGLFISLNCNSLEIINSNIAAFTVSVENNDLKVKNCSITGFNIDAQSKSNLIENCTIKTCRLDMDGVMINDCDITGMEDLNCGRYVGLKNSNLTGIGEIYPYDEGLMIDNCTFRNCNPERLIISSHNPNKVTVMNSRFINNTCDSLIDFTYCKDITLKNNLFLNNTCSKLLSWDIYIYYESGKKPNVYVNIQNNAFINNLENDRQYSKIDLATSMMDFTGKLKPFHFRIENNFLGFNMDYKRELYTTPVFDLLGEVEDQYDIMTWSNVNIIKTGDGYSLKAVNNKNQEVNLPESVFSIKDRKTGETILSGIRIGEEFSMSMDPDDAYIMNEANRIVNKPKANLTYTIVGDSYEDILIKVHLECDSKPLKDEIICMDIIETQALGSSSLVRTYTTDENGDVVLFNYNTYNPPTYGQEFENAEAYKYDFILTHSSKEFGMSQIIHKNLKINRQNAQ